MKKDISHQVMLHFLNNSDITLMPIKSNDGKGYVVVLQLLDEDKERIIEKLYVYTEDKEHFLSRKVRIVYSKNLATSFESKESMMGFTMGLVKDLVNSELDHKRVRVWYESL